MGFALLRSQLEDVGLNSQLFGNKALLLLVQLGSRGFRTSDFVCHDTSSLCSLTRIRYVGRETGLE